jgi:cystathionine beta-synthase
MICETILDAIGHTPLVRINAITRDLVRATVLAKLETFNPGNSIKDRMAVRMIEDAERADCSPGGTIIEGTRQYRHGARDCGGRQGLPMHLHDDRQAVEGEDRRAEGVRGGSDRLPTNVDPRIRALHYSVSSRLQKEVPNSWKANQ